MLKVNEKFKFKQTATDEQLLNLGFMPLVREYNLVFEVINKNEYRPPNMLYALYNKEIYSELGDYIFVGEELEKFIDLVS